MRYETHELGSRQGMLSRADRYILRLTAVRHMLCAGWTEREIIYELEISSWTYRYMRRRLQDLDDLERFEQDYRKQHDKKI